MNYKTILKVVSVSAGLLFVTVSSALAQAWDFQAQPLSDGKSARITKYIGSNWQVAIPGAMQGLPVTEIGGSAFTYENIISVIIPNSVTKIYEEAFMSNTLISVTIGSNVELDYRIYKDAGFIGAFNKDFVDFYNNNGKEAGTYTRPDANSKDWTKK